MLDVEAARQQVLSSVAIPSVLEVVGVDPILVAASRDGTVVGPLEDVSVTQKAVDIQYDGHVVTLFHSPKGVGIIMSISWSQVNVSTALWRDASLVGGWPIVCVGEVDNTLDAVGLKVPRGEECVHVLVMLVQGGGVCGWWKSSRCRWWGWWW